LAERFEESFFRLSSRKERVCTMSLISPVLAIEANVGPIAFSSAPQVGHWKSS
jgi:hypothetical protein